MADDDEEPRCKVSYLDCAEGAEEEAVWIKRAGRAKVIYPNGHSFEGNHRKHFQEWSLGIFRN